VAKFDITGTLEYRRPHGLLTPDTAMFWSPKADKTSGDCAKSTGV